MLSDITPLRTRPGEAFSCLNAGSGQDNGQRGSDRRPVGRRRQRQDRGLAERARRGRGALPGRPQRRPYAGHRQPDLQAGAAALGRGAQGQALDHRQRRRGRSLALPRGGEEGDRAGPLGDAGEPQDRQPRRADPAAAPRPRRLARGRARRHQDRHDPARHRPRLRGQGRPPRHPRRRSRRARHAAAQGQHAARAPQRAAQGPRPAAGRRRQAHGRSSGTGAQDPALRRGRLGTARQPARRRQAHPVRGRAGHDARHRPTAPIPTSPRRTRWRPRP